MEQPVKRRDLEGLKYVTSQVNTTIMADESCFDAQDALELVKRHSRCYQYKINEVWRHS